MASTSSTLSQLMQTYYDKLFIKTAEHWTIHEEGAQKRPLPQGEGKVAYFQRYSPLSISSTNALSEGSNPTAVDLSATNVSTTVSEFGAYTKISKLVSLTAIDKNLQGKVEIMAQHAGETRDEIVRDKALYGQTGNTQLVGSSALTDIQTSDTLSSDEIRKAVRTLKANKALRYDDGYFIAKGSPYVFYDLMGDSTWVNAHTYKDGEELYKGELGKLHGCRFLESTNWKETADAGNSTTDVINTMVHGKEAFGVTDLEGDKKKVYVKQPGPSSTDNPTNRFSTAGWGMTFAPATLVSDWMVEIKSSATDQG